MLIDDVTLANAIAARIPWPESDISDDAPFEYGLAVRTFVTTFAAGPYRPADQVINAIRETYGRPAGEDWQLADWARQIQQAMDGAERRDLPSWDPQAASMRAGFLTDTDIRP